MNRRMRAKGSKTRFGPYPTRCPNGHIVTTIQREVEDYERTQVYSAFCERCGVRVGKELRVYRKSPYDQDIGHLIDELREKYVGTSRQK